MKTTFPKETTKRRDVLSEFIQSGRIQVVAQMRVGPFTENPIQKSCTRCHPISNDSLVQAPVIRGPTCVSLAIIVESSPVQTSPVHTSLNKINIPYANRYFD